MKPVLKNILISVSSAIVGGALVFGAVKFSPALRAKMDKNPAHNESIYDDILKRQEGIHNKFDSLFDDEFFNHNDPFQEMKSMRKEMEKHMEQFGSGGHGSKYNPFDTWFSEKFGGGSVNDISKREDDDFVYYDIQVSDLDSTTINTKVENGYIIITGSVEKKSSPSDEDDTTQGIFRSTFKREFPLPDHVDQNKMETLYDKNKIILKFPKIKH